MASSKVCSAALAHRFLQAFLSSVAFDLFFVEMVTSTHALCVPSAKLHQNLVGEDHAKGGLENSKCVLCGFPI